jgi:hypothetical protein
MRPNDETDRAPKRPTGYAFPRVALSLNYLRPLVAENWWPKGLSRESSWARRAA